MAETKPYNRTRLPLMKDLRERTKTELKLFSRKSVIMNWRKKRKKPGEELSDREKKLQDSIAMHQANIKTLQGEFELVQMNRNGSSFFQWMPNKGMNRKQAREFKRSRKLIKNKVTNR